MSGVEIGEEKCGTGGAERAPAEKTADVDPIVFDAGESDVAVIAEMNLEIAREREIVRVEFEADPRSGGTAAAGGENAAGSVGGSGNACAGNQFSAGGNKGVGQAVIERVAAQPEGG